VLYLFYYNIHYNIYYIQFYNGRRMPMTPDDIYALRAHLQLTQELFARILGVSFATVNRWENGKSEPSGDYARVLQTLQHLTRTGVPEPPIDWKRVGALSAMAAVAGFSPLLTLGAALAPVLIAQFPSWADVPVGHTILAGANVNGVTPRPGDLPEPTIANTPVRVGVCRRHGRTPLHSRRARPGVPSRSEREK
jgi:transcriptional regulator with XRE-family HTH domain